MKYNKTKYPGIYSYDTAKGLRYHVRKGYYLKGKKKEACASGLKTIPEARKALAEIELKIANNDFDKDKNMTVDQYWGIYSQSMIDKGRWAPDTEVNKASIYRNHFGPRYGKYKLQDIDREEYEGYIDSLLKVKSMHTVRQMHGIFNAFLNAARRNKYIKDNPIDGIYMGQSVIPPRKKGLSVPDFKTWDGTAKTVLSEYEYAMIRITYFGPRKSEDYGIKIGGLNKQANGLYLIKMDDSRTYKRPNGGRMKNDDSERYMMADAETSRLLDLVLEENQRIAKKYGRILGPDDYLFIADYKRAKKWTQGKPMPLYRINRLFEKVSKACGVHVSPHMMRHFFSTQGQAAGVPVEHMAAALGHSTSYMTQKYTHIKDEVAGSVTEAFIQAIK